MGTDTAALFLAQDKHSIGFVSISNGWGEAHGALSLCAELSGLPTDSGRGRIIVCPVINPPGSSGEFLTHGRTDGSR